MNKPLYDLIIVGAGPAGLTASIYAGRYKLNTLVIGQIEGGLMTESHKICNFPSEQNISGIDLTEKIKANALSQGIEIKNAEVNDIQKNQFGFMIELDSGENYLAKTILLATGTEHRKLGLENEHKLLGHGLSYCATCDGMLYRNKIVAVAGGSDSALTAALYLAKIAKKVYLIYRGQKLRGEPIWTEKISQHPKIKVLLETNIKNLTGEERLTGVQLSKPYQGKNSVDLDGLFVEVGLVPRACNYIKNLKIEENEQNYIKVGADQKTSCPEIWAAGDITTNSNNFRQIITSCAEGAIAAEDIFHHIQSL